VAVDFQSKHILRTLIAHDVDFVVTGGIAGMARGSSMATEYRVLSDELRAPRE
jgi:hypothetical protein